MKLHELIFPFWINRNRAGASPEDITQLEREIGVALPEELRQALMLRDGGVSVYSSYRRGDLCVPVPAFLRVAELRAAERHRHTSDVLAGVPRGVLVIASGGHEWLGLDYRRGSPPSVVFREDDDAPIESVAETFEHWLDGLTED